MRCYRCGAEVGDDVRALVSWHAVTDGGQVRHPEHEEWLCCHCYCAFTDFMADSPVKGERRGSLVDALRARWGLGGKR